jgi:beta-xylosidase
MSPLLPRRGLVAFALTASALACVDEPITTSALDPDSTVAIHSEPPLGVTQYRNPVYPGDFADPYVLLDDSVYYAYATNSGSSHVPVLRSPDLVHWTSAGDALPELPGWAESGRHLTWAPAVLAVQNQYVLFYTTRDRKSQKQCVGRAESPSPAGPFVPDSSGPFICQLELGGSIDASIVQERGGGKFLIWKNDGNCCDKPVTLWSQQLSQDARRLEGSPIELLQRDQPWEGSLIEGPTMWEEQGTWHLLYSANRWNSEEYATGHAVCASPMGPCQKTPLTPVMVSDGETAGPGGAEAFTDVLGRRWLAYHGWSADRVGYKSGGARSLRIDRVELAGGSVLVLGPTSNTQVIP